MSFCRADDAKAKNLNCKINKKNAAFKNHKQRKEEL